MEQTKTGKTKNEILVEIYNDKTYTKICKAFTRGKNWEDLHSIFIAILCEKTEEKLNDIYHYLHCYCSQILVNQYYSSGSTFYYQFRKPDLTHHKVGFITETQFELADESGADSSYLFFESQREMDSVFKQMEKIISNNHWYDQYMYRFWMQEKSVRKMAKKIGISHVAVHKSIKKVKDQIRNQLKSPLNPNNN